MKKFQFSLSRALALREALARVEEAKIERLYAERAAIDARERALHQERRESQTALLSQPAVTGQELAGLAAFEHHVAAEARRSAQARVVCARQIQAQLRILILKRRDVKLLEKLKQQRQESWARELDREIEQQAEESHSAKWSRENIQ